MSQLDLHGRNTQERETSELMQSTVAPISQLLRWPAAAVLSTALLLTVVYLEQHTDFGILSIVFVLSCVAYVGFAGTLAIVFLVQIARRKFISGISALLGLFIALAVMVQAQALTEVTFQIIDNIRFSVWKDYYVQTIAGQKDQPRRFSWGSGGFLATSFFYTLVYQPDKFAAGIFSPKHEGCSVTVRELRDNFYIESEICQ
jgi:hypothetical protein